MHPRIPWAELTDTNLSKTIKPRGLCFLRRLQLSFSVDGPDEDKSHDTAFHLNALLSQLEALEELRLELDDCEGLDSTMRSREWDALLAQSWKRLRMLQFENASCGDRELLNFFACHRTSLKDVVLLGMNVYSNGRTECLPHTLSSRTLRRLGSVSSLDEFSVSGTFGSGSYSSGRMELWNTEMTDNLQRSHHSVVTRRVPVR